MFLLEKDIYLRDVLNSNIICHDLEFDENEWPYIHTNHSKIVKPYNDSIFNIRKMYKEIFSELREEDEKLERDKQNVNGLYQYTKVSKIKYTVNSLPMMTINDNYDSNLMETMGSTGQTEIF